MNITLSKAQIIVQRSSDPKTINVLFNPAEYSLQKSNTFSWKSIPGLQSPIAQYVNGQAETLSIELFFDTYERKQEATDSAQPKYQTRDVRRYTDQIVSLTKVDSDLHAPPICRFVWGSLDFKGVVEQVSQRFTMFLDSGIPVRAVLNVSFRAVLSMTEQYQETPRQSADRTKQKVLRQDEQLWMVAAEEYEDPGQWRAIAKANGIDNPRKLQAGRKLIIPRLE